MMHFFTIHFRNSLQQVILTVQTDFAAVLHVMENFCLGAENTFPVVKIFQMTLSDICNDTDVRLCHFA